LKAELWKTAALVLAIAAVAGCAAGRAYSKAEQAARAGDWDAAVQYYSQALQASPNSADYRIALERAQLTASRAHLDKGRELESKGDLEGAVVEFQKAATYDPSNRRAAAKAAELEQTLRARIEAARPKPPIEQMKERAKQATEPLLNPASRQPLLFKFAAGLSVRQILDILGQASGINLVFENTFQETTTKSVIDLDGVTLEQALNVVMTANNLFYKVLNPKSILVIPDTAQLRLKYEDQVIQTFYLSHADPMVMQTLLNGLLVAQTQQSSRPQIMPNKDSNSITIRGSASMVAIAGRIIENNDKPRAEVVIDVEILEVNRTRVKSYGLNLSNYQIGLQFSPDGPPSSGSGTTPTTGTGTFNLNTVAHGINTADFYGSIPSAVMKFLESDSQTKLIAKPSLRGTEGTKLTANLGDEIPVPSTTFQPLVSGGAGINPFTSFTYKSVGVNVEVTPRVTLDGDVILELMVESSTKGSDVNVAGQNLPSFGSRKVTTKMRLGDGESNLLAGLLRDDERKSLVGFPGGIHVPLIKDLFSANDSQISQTDIVMLLTPHIIRTQGVTERNLQGIYIGTAQNPMIGGAPALLGAGTSADTTETQTATVPPLPAPPITTQPYGTPGAALVGGAPVGRPTPQGTPVVPPGSTPIPGTVMMPPAQPAAQAPAQAMPVVQPPAQPAAQPAAPAAAPVPPPSAAAPVASAAVQNQVVITTPGSDWRVGQGPYTVALSAANLTRVSTISLTLTYNPATLKIRSLQEGSFMRSGVPTTAFAHQEDQAAGRIDVTISRSGDLVGATGSGTLAAVIFDAVAPGTVNFRVSGVASGPGGNVPLQFTPATVMVK
jgi:type II secretory pathway component GspD/PulD (secretin)